MIRNPAWTWYWITTRLPSTGSAAPWLVQEAVACVSRLLVRAPDEYCLACHANECSVAERHLRLALGSVSIIRRPFRGEAPTSRASSVIVRRAHAVLSVASASGQAPPAIESRTCPSTGSKTHTVCQRPTCLATESLKGSLTCGQDKAIVKSALRSIQISRSRKAPPSS